MVHACRVQDFPSQQDAVTAVTDASKLMVMRAVVRAVFSLLGIMATPMHQHTGPHSSNDAGGPTTPTM
jgi:hypothetical protein